MPRIVRTLFVLSGLLLLPLAAKNAYAGPITQFQLTWSGAFGNGSGIFTTTQLLANEFEITAISGSQSGGSISLLKPGSLNGNNNFLYTTGAYVDDFGFAFLSGSTKFDIHFDPVALTYVECSSVAGCGAGAPLTTFRVAQLGLPEPSSIVTLCSGLIVFFAVVRRKRPV